MGASRRSDTARAALDHVAAAQPTVSTATLAPGTDAGALFALRGDHVGWATVWLVAGPPTGQLTARFVDRVIRLWRSHGYPVRAVGTDNRPEYVAAGFRATLAAKGINHVRIPPRSANHNAVVERFGGTILQECWRPAFHRRRFNSIPPSSKPRPTRG